MIQFDYIDFIGEMEQQKHMMVHVAPLDQGVHVHDCIYLFVEAMDLHTITNVWWIVRK